MPEQINPFLFSRREFEEDITIFVTGDKEGFFTWITEQQFLLEGLRGSGKSSILKSMEYDVAWKMCNTKLKGPRDIKKIFTPYPKHLGVLCRFEVMDTYYWDVWKEQVGKECAQKYFGTYLEYLLIYLFLNSILKIIQKHPELFVNAESEYNLIQDIVQTGFPDVNSRPRLPEQSLWALNRVIKDKCFGIRDCVYRTSSKEAMYNLYPVLSPGSLVQCFGESLTTNYDTFSDTKIFPMLDDCNHLNSWQLQVVNSAISKAKTPVSYKVTSVYGLYNTRRTIDNRPVTEHELKTLKISGSDPAKWKYTKSFEKLVNGVCQTRIETHYDEELAKQFDFKRILGKFDLHNLLEKTLSDSEKIEAIDLLQLAKNEAKEKGKRISITSTWLSKMRVREKKEPSHKNLEIQKKLLRRLDSMYIKKWSYSAAVAICQELKLSFPYSGWSTILHLSCGSIREVLRIMSEIWDELHEPIEKFIQKKNISHLIQKRAIKNASTKALEAIDKKPLFEISNNNGKDYSKTNTTNYPTSLPSVCMRLGNLFAKFQSYPSICVTAETASLKLKSGELDDEIIGAINFAVMCGVIIKTSSESGFLEVGLHPILSPIYNISFRSPFYNPESVSGKDFIRLFKGNDAEAKKVREKIVDERMARYLKSKENKNNKQMYLFGNQRKDR